MSEGSSRAPEEGVPRRALEELVQRAHKSTLELFLAQTPSPWLIRLGSGIDPDALERARNSVQTVHGNAPTTKRPGRPLQAYAVAKRSGANAFAFMITLGRTANNDIAIEEEPVSKFHASFAREGNGPWTISDMGRNGTWLDGVRLEARRPTPLRSGVTLALADSVALRFFEPSELHAYLRTACSDGRV